jgi:hypothetical protein
MTRYLFVCGAPKSGTTWLQNLLDMHPRVSCGGEGHFVEMVTRPLAELVKTYNRKLELVADRVYQGKAPYPPLRQADYDELCRQTLTMLMRRKAGAEGADWLGDKTPRYTEFLPRLRQLFPEARFFHIVRDPRDVVVSRLHHARRAGVISSVEGADAAERERLLDNAVSAWALSIRGVAKFSRQHGDQLLEVRYEDLSATPRETTERLFGHLDITLGAEELDRLVADSSFEVMSGGIARGANDPNSFFRSGRPGEHATTLTQAELARIQAALAAPMERYGYR